MNLSWTFDIPNQPLDLIAVVSAGVIILVAIGYVCKLIYQKFKK